MFLSHFKGFIHALPDCHTGNDHNKLAPAVVFVQLKHGLDIGVSFANASFHLNGKVISILPALQFFRRLDLIGTLNLV